MSKTKSQSGKGVGGNGHISRKALYAKISRKAPQVIDFLFETMNDEKTQKSVRLSAANKLIDKVLPNISAQELMGKDGERLPIAIFGGSSVYTYDSNKEDIQTEEANTGS